MTAQNVLEVRGLTKRFGGLVAVSDVSFDVRAGEIFGIIGPNGAGKTTLFNVVAGHYKPTAGRVGFDGGDITARSSDQISRLGIARTFQAVHLFAKETVGENLRRAELLARYHSPLQFLRRGDRSKRADLADVAAFLGFDTLLDAVAGSLPYGFQKKLGVGMAMMVGPKLLLMDEPAAGLNPSEKKTAATLIRKLRDERGITVLLVEHDMPMVMDVCDRILVVNRGKPIALDTPAAVKVDPAVIEGYLGEDYEFA